MAWEEMPRAPNRSRPPVAWLLALAELCLAELSSPLVVACASRRVASTRAPCACIVLLPCGSSRQPSG
eukprot:scaffold8646_cov115-Isochrysis_galbana.AAC.4